MSNIQFDSGKDLRLGIGTVFLSSLRSYNIEVTQAQEAYYGDSDEPEVILDKHRSYTFSFTILNASYPVFSALFTHVRNIPFPLTFVSDNRFTELLAGCKVSNISASYRTSDLILVRTISGVARRYFAL